jgi:hypothetical protein
MPVTGFPNQSFIGFFQAAAASCWSVTRFDSTAASKAAAMVSVTTSRRMRSMVPRRLYRPTIGSDAGAHVPGDVSTTNTTAASAPTIERPVA